MLQTKTKIIKNDFVISELLSCFSPTLNDASCNMFDLKCFELLAIPLTGI